MIDIFELVLVEDVLDHPVCRTYGWNIRELKKMIRDGRLDGKKDSNGEYYVSEESLLRKNFGLQMDLVLKQRSLELGASGDPSLNHEEIAFCHLFSNVFNIKIRTVDQLLIDRIKSAIKPVEA